jgi:predicted transcriptional regulator
MEISEEVQRAYYFATRLEYPSHRAEAKILADALRDILAWRLEAENGLSNKTPISMDEWARRVGRTGWTDADWKAEAHRQLMGES